MGNLLSSNSTSSTPRLYEGIKLLLADPEKQFPEGFDPKKPFKVKALGKVSRESFVKCVERETGAYVVAVENFDPTGVVNQAPEEVDLCDEATFIVVPREDQTTEKRVSAFAAFVICGRFSN